MTTAGQPRVTLAAPLIGLILVGAVVTILIYLEPTALYGTAVGILLVCLVLLGAALMARRKAPRAEVPDPARLELWIREARHAGTPAAARALLSRLGRWPHHLYAIDPATRERVRRLVEETGSMELLEARLDPEVPWSRRVEALHLLAWLDLSGAEQLLIDRLGDPDTEVASAAASALARSGSETALDALVMGLGGTGIPASRLATLLEDADPRLLLAVVAKHAANEDPERRFWMAHLAGRAGDDRALPILLDLSRDPSVDVRANAAESLGRLGRDDGRSLLHELLEDESWVVRAHAARALGELGPGPSVAELAGRLHDPSWWVRENAVLALDKLDPADAPRLIPMLADAQGAARTALEDVLSNLGALPDNAVIVAPPEHHH